MLKRVLWILSAGAVAIAVLWQAGPYGLFMLAGIAAGLYLVGSAYDDLRNDILRVEHKVGEIQRDVELTSRRVKALHASMERENRSRVL